MPILTPCADAGTANNRLHAATALDHNPNLILASKFSVQVSVPATIIYNPAAAHLFHIRL
jgi:hypothetical protein